MSLLDPSHSPSLLSHSDTTFFTSGVLCLAVTSAVLVFTVMANVAHAFLLYVEQALYATDVTTYLTLICSPKIMAAMLISAWLGPLALALLPLLPGQVNLDFVHAGYYLIVTHRSTFSYNRFKQLERILLSTGCLVEGIPLGTLGGADGLRDCHISTLHEGQVEGQDDADIQASCSRALSLRRYASHHRSRSTDNFNS